MPKCKFCVKILIVDPSGRTRHLKTHREKCARKHLRGKQPMQSQLQFNKGDLVSTWTNDLNLARKSLSQLIVGMNLPISFGESFFYEDHVRILYCP